MKVFLGYYYLIIYSLLVWSLYLKKKYHFMSKILKGLSLRSAKD